MNIAVFVKNYPIGRSPSILLLLDLLKRQNHSVVLIVENAEPIPAHFKDKFYLIRLPRSRAGKLPALLRLKLRGFDLAIAVDPYAFHLAAWFIDTAKIVYYNVELYLRGFAQYEYDASLATFLRQTINGCAGLIIQSEERKQLFAKDYGVAAWLPTLLLPTCSKSAQGVRPRVLPKPGRRVLLHLGGIRADYGVLRFCEAISRQENWMLLLHGHGGLRDVSEIRQRISGYYAGYYRNVVLDDVYFDSVDEAEMLCAKSNLGLAWFDAAVSPDFDTATFSSGKIAIYLKYGLPIVVRKSDSFDVLERAGCAVAIETPERLPEALAHIEKNYPQMSQCAIDTFGARYNFSQYEAAIQDFLLACAKQPARTQSSPTAAI